ncbi:phosphoserine phosphatase SerB [Rhodomicrobium lacus]|uniref:phosphoserine phosphatase SerB n=1 Tax=Rhodomicrobium lacus TaxID=2498452 RepID=UPI0026E37CB3|nr:phosphoserine phosphatase SerB [Rhodomicrobium lacus]WKW49555.1 phosphoserine phosphatase SerB [Rhodomicrobium lacus]
MDIAITLTAAPESKDLLLDLSAQLQRDLNGDLEFGWLSEGEALDLILPLGPDEKVAEGDLKQAVAAAVGDAPVDFCVQAAQGRRKRMLIADMDSTIIAQECLDEIADFAGIKPQVAAITERAMRGELDFADALHERIALLIGLPKTELSRVLAERITLNRGAQALVETMNAHRAHTVLVSGGFTYFTRAVGGMAGFAKNRANQFIWEDGKLAGVAEPILGREAKLAALNEEAAANGLSPEDAIAVGDGANDLSMLKAAGLGVAFRAKPVVAAEADTQVRYTELTTLLFFQGYKRADFVTSIT